MAPVVCAGALAGMVYLGGAGTQNQRWFGGELELALVGTGNCAGDRRYSGNCAACCLANCGTAAAVMVCRAGQCVVVRPPLGAQAAEFIGAADPVFAQDCA